MALKKGVGYWTGKKRSEETKRKISETKKLNPTRYWLGKKRPEMSGELHPLFGIGHTKETRNKMSKIKKEQYESGLQVWNFIDGKAEKRKRLSTKKVRRIWCENNHLAAIPQGWVIHHINLNPMNNNPDNLCLLDKKSHSQLHNGIMKIIKHKEEPVWQNFSRMLF
jgi:hypothetical protein